MRGVGVGEREVTLAVTSAPWATNTATAEAWPARAAKCSGVWPLRSRLCVSTPCDSMYCDSHATTSTCRGKNSKFIISLLLPFYFDYYHRLGAWNGSQSLLEQSSCFRFLFNSIKFVKFAIFDSWNVVAEPNLQGGKGAQFEINESNIHVSVDKEFTNKMNY